MFVMAFYAKFQCRKRHRFVATVQVNDCGCFDGTGFNAASGIGSLQHYEGHGLDAFVEVSMPQAA